MSESGQISDDDIIQSVNCTWWASTRLS